MCVARGGGLGHSRGDACCAPMPQGTGEDSRCKITDFGLAFITESSDVHRSLVGTPGCVACPAPSDARAGSGANAGASQVCGARGAVPPRVRACLRRVGPRRNPLHPAGGVPPFLRGDQLRGSPCPLATAGSANAPSPSFPSFSRSSSAASTTSTRTRGARSASPRATLWLACSRWTPASASPPTGCVACGRGSRAAATPPPSPPTLVPSRHNRCAGTAAPVGG